MKVNPLDPALMKTWNQAFRAGENKATKTFNEFLVKKMQTLTEIDGVGEKTAWKIQEHFLKELEGVE